MPEEKCSLCLKKVKELEKKCYQRTLLKVKLCGECCGDVEYLAKLKKRPEGWVYERLFDGKKNLKNPKSIYDKNHENNQNGHQELENEVPEE